MLSDLMLCMFASVGTMVVICVVMPFFILAAIPIGNKKSLSFIHVLISSYFTLHSDHLLFCAELLSKDFTRVGATHCHFWYNPSL